MLHTILDLIRWKHFNSAAIGYVICVVVENITVIPEHLSRGCCSVKGISMSYCILCSKCCNMSVSEFVNKIICSVYGSRSQLFFRPSLLQFLSTVCSSLTIAYIAKHRPSLIICNLFTYRTEGESI